MKMTELKVNCLVCLFYVLTNVESMEGPACAIACGAATIYRNYFVPVKKGQRGQTKDSQLNGLRDFEQVSTFFTSFCSAVFITTCLQVLKKKMREKMDDIAEDESLWKMQNGYCFPERKMLKKISEFLGELEEGEEERDEIMHALQVGYHEDVQVTLVQDREVFVNQVFCSALPVAYSRISPSLWEEFCKIILEGSYIATLALAAQNRKSNVCFLTCLGGGAFGVDDDIIEDSIRKALQLFNDYDLDVRIVTFSKPPKWIEKLVLDYEL